MKLATKKTKPSKSISKLKKELQIVFNSFIRIRDKEQPCISCGKFKYDKQAGHYYPVSGYDGLRFNEFNVNGECQKCNLFDESHLIGYGENLKERIGVEAFEHLKHLAKDYKEKGYKFTRTELASKIDWYKQEIKRMS